MTMEGDIKRLQNLLYDIYNCSVMLFTELYYAIQEWAKKLKDIWYNT